MAAGGAALSAGAGAVASAASALFSTVSGPGAGASSGAPSGVSRPHNSNGARPNCKVYLYLFTFLSATLSPSAGDNFCSQGVLWVLVFL